MIVPHHVYIALSDLKMEMKRTRNYVRKAADAEGMTSEGKAHYLGYAAEMDDAMIMLERCIDTL